MGLAVDAVFHNARDGEFYPRVLARVREAVAPALREAAVVAGRAAPASLARQSLEPAAEAVDRGLSAVAESFGFLLQVTPVNADAAWDEFNGGGCERPPELLYRPLTFDPDAARRDLFDLPLEEVEDPVVAGLLRECRDEIEGQIRMILDVGTPQFLPNSLRLYGSPDRDLVDLAHALVAALDATPADDGRGGRRGDGVRGARPAPSSRLPRAVRGVHADDGRRPGGHHREPDGLARVPPRRRPRAGAGGARRGPARA